MNLRGVLAVQGILACRCDMPTRPPQFASVVRSTATTDCEGTFVVAGSNRFLGGGGCRTGFMLPQRQAYPIAHHIDLAYNETK